MGNMAKLIKIKKIADERGSLSVIEDELGFDIKRLFYIYDVPIGKERGGHGHYKTCMGMIAIGGSCHVEVATKNQIQNFYLDQPDRCLLLYPEEWHRMYNFENNITLLVLASERFNKNDYFYDKPK